MLGSWSGMAGQIAEATGAETPGERHDTILKERRTMKDKWVSGEITDEQWKPFIRQSGKAEDKLLAVSGFQTDYLSKMQGLVSAPGAGAMPGFQSKMYEQMSGISMQRGEMGPAKDYMEKSLTALAESFKGDKELAEKQLAAEERTAKATEEMAGSLKKDKGESQPGATKSSPTQSATSPVAGPAAEDEITETVKGSYTNRSDGWWG